MASFTVIELSGVEHFVVVVWGSPEADEGVIVAEIMTHVDAVNHELEVDGSSRSRIIGTETRVVSAWPVAHGTVVGLVTNVAV